MGYVGVPPQSGFITTAKQRVTSSTNNYVDLDHSISSLADVIVWVNFVKQDSTNLTLTTSTRITLGGTLVSSDIVEIAYLGKAVATQNPSTNSVTNDMLVNSSITLNGSAVSLGGSANTSFFSSTAFSSYIGSTQTFASSTQTTLTFNTERYDLGSNFNTSTYAYTPPSTGYYLFNLGASFRGGANSNLGRCNLSIAKGGSTYMDWEKDFSASYVLNAGTAISKLIHITNTDAITVFVNVTDQSGQPSVLGTITNSYFEGYRIA
jgi:hypothetical protein